jgi:outer membrane lipoprotein LolB
LSGEHPAERQSPVRCFRAALLLAVALQLGSCATTPELIPLESSDTASSWVLRQDALNQLSQWALDGRLAVSADGQGWYAGLDWRQTGAAYHLELRGPLGQGRLWIDGDAGGVAVVAGDGTVNRGPSAEQLLASAYGWRLPISGLRYWVRGLPDPDTAINQLSLDPLGRLERLHQAGWRIAYSAYQDLAGVDLPGKITIDGHGLSLRLVVDEWG